MILETSFEYLPIIIDFMKVLCGTSIYHQLKTTVKLLCNSQPKTELCAGVILMLNNFDYYLS